MLRVPLFAAVVCAAACVGSGATPQRATVAQIANGRQLYISAGCQECHGYSGQGSAGPRLAPQPIPLEIFSRQLRNPRGVMPIYTPVLLSDSGLADIYAYLNSIPKPTPVADLPLLR